MEKGRLRLTAKCGFEKSTSSYQPPHQRYFAQTLRDIGDLPTFIPHLKACCSKHEVKMGAFVEKAGLQGFPASPEGGSDIHQSSKSSFFSPQKNERSKPNNKAMQRNSLKDGVNEEEKSPQIKG